MCNIIVHWLQAGYLMSMGKYKVMPQSLRDDADDHYWMADQ